MSSTHVRRGRGSMVKLSNLHLGITLLTDENPDRLVEAQIITAFGPADLSEKTRKALTLLGWSIDPEKECWTFRPISDTLGSKS